jgi:hypothetical protein
MRFLDIFSPGPLLTEEERALSGRMSRSHYALRAAGWMVRCLAVVAALTLVGGLIRKPTLRSGAALAMFVVRGVVGLGIAGTFAFLIAAWRWPAMRREAADLAAMNSENGEEIVVAVVDDPDDVR